MRAALYARFSSDLQNAGSIGDQLVACRRHAERLGATVVGEFSDAAISGASMVNRPGLADLMAAAKRGAIDVVIAEALDRLTRSGGDAWDIFDDLKALGVRISTTSEGDVSMLHVGVMGTMNAIFLDELGKKVRRGLEGVVRSGRHPASPPYGYRRRREYDAAGEPIRGLIEIDETQAQIVRRIAAEFVAGMSPYMIAANLNADGVPGPGGRPWTHSMVGGRARYLDGVLRNPLYAGERIWNRTSQTKDRRTGKTRTRSKPEAEWVREPVPELRIIDADSWAKIGARQDATAEAVAAANNPSAANQPKRLLSGLISCGTCGGTMHTSGGQRAYRCLVRMRQGLAVCSNSRSVPPSKLEPLVLEYLRRDLLHPEVIEAFVREYHAAQRDRGADARREQAAIERELGETQRRADRLVDQVADGVLSGATVKAKLADLEARATALRAQLDKLNASAEVVTLNPRAAARYRQLVEDLQTALGRAHAGAAELSAAREALRKVISTVVIHPLPGRGQWRAEVRGDLTSLLNASPAQTANARTTK